MADINALMGIGITKEEELQALAEQLRGRKQAADWFGATTVPSIRDAANREQEIVTSAAQQGGALKRALEQRKLLEQEGERNRAASLARTLAQLQSENSKPDKPLKTESLYNKDTRKRETVGLFPDGTMKAAGQDGGWVTVTPDNYEQAMPPASLNKAVTDVSEDARTAGTILRQFSALHGLLAPYKEGGEKEAEWGDIPGTRFFESKEGIAGTMGEYFPAILTGDFGEIRDTQVIKAVIQEIANTVIREQSGLTQTKGEIERVREQLGKKLLQDPQVQLNALRRLQQAILADVQNLRSRSPQVIDAYMSTLEEGQQPVWEAQLPEFNFINEGMTGLEIMAEGNRAKEMEAMIPEETGIDSVDWNDEQERRYQELMNKRGVD